MGQPARGSLDHRSDRSVRVPEFSLALAQGVPEVTAEDDPSPVRDDFRLFTEASRQVVYRAWMHPRLHDADPAEGPRLRHVDEPVLEGDRAAADQ